MRYGARPVRDWRGSPRQLTQQQTDREHRRQLIEFDQTRRRELSDFDRRIHDARSRADMLEAQLKLMDAKLAAMRGFWNYFRRRRLAEEIASERDQWDQAVMLVTDLSDDRTDLEATPPPEFVGISIDGRRVVNTAVIAYAQQLVASLSAGGLAMLAKETTSKRLFDVRYGSPTECARLMTQLRDSLTMMKDDNEDLSGLKERTDGAARQRQLSQRCGHGAADRFDRHAADADRTGVGPGDRRTAPASMCWLTTTGIYTSRCFSRSGFSPTSNPFVQRAALSSHTYIDGTISSDTIVENASPPMIARAIG